MNLNRYLHPLDRSLPRTALLYLLVVVAGVTALYGHRLEEILKAVVDLNGPDVSAMRIASVGFIVYVASAVALGLCVLFLLTGGLRDSRSRTGSFALPSVLVALGGAVLVIGIYVDTTVFRDYGIHFYEYDLVGLVSDATAIRDLGIRPRDSLIVGLGAAVILCLGALTYVGVGYVARRLPTGTGPVAAALLVGTCTVGLMVYGANQGRVGQERHDFLSSLPARRVMLLGGSGRPHLPVRPKLGEGGYPDASDPTTSVPRISSPRNVIVILGDGLRADFVNDSMGLTPNLSAFAARPEVLSPRRHYTAGPATETGVFGLVYALDAFAYHPFLKAQVPAFPLEVLRQNGYVTALITGSRIIRFPSGQLFDSFDEQVSVDSDREVVEAFEAFVGAREADGRPYLVVVFFYSPHWPFESVEDDNRRFRPDLADGGRSPFRKVEDAAFRVRVRNAYRNAVLQFDDLFSRTFERVRGDYEAGETAVAVTSDHGTEIWEHGLFGQGRSTFWNEKVLVPFYFGMPGQEFEGESRTPEVSAHTDFFPTLFDYLGADPDLPPVRYSHGRSLLAAEAESGVPDVMLTGRYFPWADRLNALVTGGGKFWFHVRGVEESGRFDVVPDRTTDLADRLLDGAPLDPPDPALRRLEEKFWRFLTY